jgi:hypothetical protein
MSRPRVSYFFDSEIGNFHYGQGHPMKVHSGARSLGRARRPTTTASRPYQLVMGRDGCVQHDGAVAAQAACAAPTEKRSRSL